MNTLQYILKPVSEELAVVERELREQLAEIAESHTLVNPYSKLGDRAVSHLFRTHGKRLRPALFLLSAKSVGRALGDRATALTKIATSVELIHSASLIHDDVIDEATFRRKRSSVNERYGNKIAVLAGDILYTQFYALVGSLPDIPVELRLNVLGLFTDVTRRMCFGEIYEERMRNDRTQPRFADYIDTIENKTASLMAGCCEAGALVAGADPGLVETLRAYGYHLGMAYQLLDDLDDGDAVFTDADRIAEAAAYHVNSALKTLPLLPDNPAALRLKAMVETVSGSRLPEPSNARASD